MAIRINVTANVSNINDIRKKIENQLKDIKLTIGSSGGTGGKGGLTSKADTTNLEAQTSLVSQLIKMLKAKDISMGQFTRLAADLNIELLKTNDTLTERAKLTQAVATVQAKMNRDSTANAKKEMEAQKEKIKSINQVIQYEKQLATSAKLKEKITVYRQESEALKQLVRDARADKVSLDELKKSSNSLISSLKKQEAIISDLGGKTKTMIAVRQEEEAQLKEIISAYAKEEKAKQKSLSKNIKANVKSEIKAYQDKIKAIEDQAKAYEKAAAKERTIGRQYEKKAIEASFAQQQQKAADSIKNTITQYEKGVISLNQFILRARELQTEFKGQANVSKEMKKMYDALDKAATQYWKDAEAATAAEKKALQEEMAQQKAALQLKREEQQLRAAINRIKREVSGENYKKDISSQEAYNAVMKKQIELFRSRRMSAEDFIAVTNRMIEQEKNLSNVDNNLYRQLQTNRDKATATIQRQAKMQEKANSSIRGQTGAIASANKGLKGYIANLGMIIKKFSDWILVSSIVFLPIRVFQEAIDYIIEMDDALTDLNKVVELSTSQLDSMRSSAIELGKSLGVSSAEIMKGMAEFGRITKVQTDIENLSKAAAVAANVTTMTADEAAKAINTTLITFKKDISEAMSIIDAFNEVQNNFRTSAEDLSESIDKVGAAARQAGIDLEDLAGYTTAIVSATGTTGNVAGTAIKSIISRIYRIGTEGESSAGKAEEALRNIGVAVRDASGNFRDFDSIIRDLSKEWSGLSNVTQQNIAQVLAGKTVLGSMVTYGGIQSNSVKLLCLE